MQRLEVSGEVRPIYASLGFKGLNSELNHICHLLALLGDATIVVVSRLRVKNDVKEGGPCIFIFNT